MKISYEKTKISDLEVLTETAGTRTKAKGIIYKGDVYTTSDRFWTSLCSRFGINPSMFRYFDHAEVFTRIGDRMKGGHINLTIEDTNEESTDDWGTTTEKKPKRLLGVCNPVKPIANYSDLVATLKSYGAEDIKYHEGIITSQHTPRVDNGFTTVGDSFRSKFYLSTPVDGYGLPSAYLGLLRLACSNGMVAMSKAFKSDLSIGKGEDNVMPAITRAIDSFNNDEGYANLQNRIETATKSWASIYEAESLQRVLFKCFRNSELTLDKDTKILDHTRIRQAFPTGEALEEYMKIGQPIFKAFHQMTGDTHMIYGLTNVDTLSSKRQKALPVKCSTYDLLNFATEVATHYAKPSASAQLQGWMGEMISNEFDMENTMEVHKDFADFHIKSHLDLVTESVSKN